jgi:hypothetical protein
VFVEHRSSSTHGGQRGITPDVTLTGCIAVPDTSDFQHVLQLPSWALSGAKAFPTVIDWPRSRNRSRWNCNDVRKEDYRMVYSYSGTTNVNWNDQLRGGFIGDGLPFRACFSLRSAEVCRSLRTRSTRAWTLKHAGKALDNLAKWVASLPSTQTGTGSAAPWRWLPSRGSLPPTVGES